MEKFILPLNLQFFAEEEGKNEGGNPTPKDVSFTQEQVNAIVQERLQKNTKSIYKKLGIDKEEDITSLLEKSSKADEYSKKISEYEQQIEGYKKKETEYSYKAKLKQVDDDCIDYIYSQVAPQENESADDYATRVNEYLEKHPKYKRDVVGNVSTNPTTKKSTADDDLQALRNAK